MNESMVPDSSPLAKLQHQQSASNMTINTTSQTKAQTQQYTSKIGRRFGKYNKTLNKDENEIGTVLGDTITINATSTVYSEQTLKESDTSTQKTGSPQKIQQVHEVFKVNKVFEYVFPIYHIALKTEDGIWAIAEKTFPNQEIDGHKDLFVNSQENVFLYRLSSQSNSSHEVKSSMLKSSSNVQTFFNHPVSGDQEEESSFIGHPSIFRKGHHNHINSIKIEIYGACFPKKSHVGALIQMIESSLQQITIVKLAGQLIFHKGYITKEDHNYIEGADQKLFVAFPLDESGITDQFGLLKYLKQNLQRVLNPVTQGGHPIKSRGPLGATILGQTQSNETADLGNRNIWTQSILSGHSNRVDDSQRVR